MRKFILTLLLPLLVLTTFSGCSGSLTQSYCWNLPTSGPLKYVGTVISVITGQVVETACLTIDLTQIDLTDIKPGDIIGIELISGSGDLGAEQDNSLYKVTVINEINRSDNHRLLLSEPIVPGTNIKPKP